ncbi:MAG: flagellar export chaperone FlgN [Balneolaceae bacterium]
MRTQDNSESKLKIISDKVEKLNSIFTRLLNTMERQVEAIVASDSKKIEVLTEEHSNLSSEYKKAEKEFILELENLFRKKIKQPLRLSNLKELYPQEADRIEGWRELLTANTQKLQQKHEHVVRLLEFALLRNSSMMRSIYSIQNSKTAHYNLEGNKENKMSGLAVNQEI